MKSPQGSFRFCWTRGTILVLCLGVTFRENRGTVFPEALQGQSRRRRMRDQDGVSKMVDAGECQVIMSTKTR
jgi:hypothetical protein